MSFFSGFGYLNSLTSWWPFCLFRLRHSHGRYFDPTLFKYEYVVARGNPVFAIGNQPNRSVTLEPHVQLSRLCPKSPPKITFSDIGKRAVVFKKIRHAKYEAENIFFGWKSH